MHTPGEIEPNTRAALESFLAMRGAREFYKKTLYAERERSFYSVAPHHLIIASRKFHLKLSRVS